jgi:hypothetical protein
VAGLVGGESNILFPQIRGRLQLVTLSIGISTATSNDTLMLHSESCLSKQKGAIMVTNGFDRTEGTVLLSVDCKNITTVKCDMHDGAIILKYDTELMTSEEEDTRVLFSLSCSVVCPLVQSLCWCCQPINNLSADRLVGCFLLPYHLLNEYTSSDFIRT